MSPERWTAWDLVGWYSDVAGNWGGHGVQSATEWYSDVAGKVDMGFSRLIYEWCRRKCGHGRRDSWVEFSDVSLVTLSLWLYVGFAGPGFSNCRLAASVVVPGRRNFKSVEDPLNSKEKYLRKGFSHFQSESAPPQVQPHDVLLTWLFHRSRPVRNDTCHSHGRSVVIQTWLMPRVSGHRGWADRPGVDWVTELIDLWHGSTVA